MIFCLDYSSQVELFSLLGKDTSLLEQLEEMLPSIMIMTRLVSIGVLHPSVFSVFVLFFNVGLLGLGVQTESPWVWMSEFSMTALMSEEVERTDVLLLRLYLCP
jgi:hypothetical protein